MKPKSERRRLTGIVAVATLASACTASPPASPRASHPASRPPARAIGCTTVHISSGPAAGPSGQHARPGWLSVPAGELLDVAAQSPGRAYAVGAVRLNPDHPKALAAYWNGAVWRTLSTGSLPRDSELDAVAAFPGGAWAVGEHGLNDDGDGGGVASDLLVRVTGTTVRRVQLPGPAYGALVDVAATSASNAWAVGSGRGAQLMLHWNGTAWTRSPLPWMGGSVFTGVAATSATDAWAVTYAGRRGHLPPIMHWDGRRWREVVSPDIGVPYALSDVAATSSTDVWAVGSAPPYTYKGLFLHWNGRRWACARILRHGLSYRTLVAVTASSPDNAWAVGETSALNTLALHWNGHSWKQVPTGPPGFLHGVAVIPHSGNAWAVGGAETLMMYWDGTAWR
jgi:hypothetical protein